MAAPGDGDAPGAGDGAQGGAHGVVTLPTPCLEQIAVIHPAIVHLPGEEEMWSISVDKVTKGVHPPAVVRMPRSDDKDVGSRSSGSDKQYNHFRPTLRSMPQWCRKMALLTSSIQY